MNETNALQKTTEKPMEFIPFGATNKIMLNVKIVQRLLCKPTRSGRVCSDQDALRFMMLCQSKGLNPFEGDAFLVGYDSRQQDGSILAEFSLITAHQAFLKRAERHPEFDGMRSGVIVQNEGGEVLETEGDFRRHDQKLLGGWATVYFKNRKVPMMRRLRLESRQKQTKFWTADPEGLICKCAEADALRSSFPTLLGGMYTREEGKVPEITPGEAHSFSTANLPEQAAVEAEIVTDDTDDGDLGPQTAPRSTDVAPTPTKTNPPAGSAKDELQQLVLSNGFNFEHLRRWGLESGNLTYADSIAGFDEIKEADAKRLVRAKVGLLQGLKVAKQIQ